MITDSPKHPSQRVHPVRSYQSFCPHVYPLGREDRGSDGRALS